MENICICERNELFIIIIHLPVAMFLYVIIELFVVGAARETVFENIIFMVDLVIRRR